MATPEGAIKTKLKARLKRLNLKYEFWPVQMGFGSTTLDCLLCINSTFVAIETKAPGKKLTPRQTKTKLDIEAAGGFVFVIDSEHSLNDVMEVLVAIDRGGLKLDEDEILKPWKRWVA